MTSPTNHAAGPGRALLALALAFCTSLVVGCDPAAVGSSAPVAGVDWRAAQDVARPSDAFPVESDPPSGPVDPGEAGHPGHFPGQATMADVVERDGRLVAVGYVGWDWRPVAWTSVDGDRWDLVEIGRSAPEEPAFAVAVADGPDGVIAVGRAGSRPLAWTSADGSAWTERTVEVLGGPDDWERMTAVASGPLGILAGGSVGPELFERRARFWRSQDGTIWTPVADDPGFEGAEVVAIIPIDDGWLALGRIGTGQRSTSSVAWRSTDGQRWTLIDDPELAKGLVRAVARAPDGTLVAVGSDADETAAWAWRSSDDGQTWDLAPDEDSRTHHGRKIRMTDVIATDTGLLGVGNFVGLQYGDGAAWASDDGEHWERSPRQPAMGQVEPSSVLRVGDGFVIVGTFGAPDNYIPRVLVSPPE